MVQSIISTEARKFLETTSVRGVPRIIKSKSKGLFVIWLLGVLTCTGFLIWQLTMVFIKYAAYPVNTLFVQSPDGQNPTFPDITICNICPLVHENDKSLRYTDYVKTLNKTLSYNAVKEYFASEYNTSITQEFRDWMFTELVAPSTYFSNFPIKSSLTSDPNDDPTIMCDYFNWYYGPTFYNGECLGKITPIWNPDYYKCYKFQLPITERNNVRGFSAIFYVDKFLDSQLTDFQANLQNSQATGMRVMVHSPGTQPDMKLGVSVSPGMETTITLEHTLTTHLPEPYSNCTSQQTVGPLDEITTYTQDYCTDVCLQKQYIQQYGCVWSTLQFTDKQLEQTNNLVCGNLSITEANSTVNWTGVYNFFSAQELYVDPDACFDECRTPCAEYDYDVSISAAAWPHISTQVSFYNTFIRYNSRFDTTFDEHFYFVVENEDEHGVSNSTELLQKLDSQGLIASNFLQLNIVFDSRKFDVRKDVAAIPFEALGAQIGGVLSLWLGVTIMLVFEVVEFFFTILAALCESKKNSSTIKIQVS